MRGGSWGSIRGIGVGWGLVREEWVCLQDASGVILSWDCGAGNLGGVRRG